MERLTVAGACVLALPAEVNPALPDVCFSVLCFCEKISRVVVNVFPCFSGIALELMSRSSAFSFEFMAGECSGRLTNYVHTVSY